MRDWLSGWERKKSGRGIRAEILLCKLVMQTVLRNYSVEKDYHHNPLICTLSEDFLGKSCLHKMAILVFREAIHIK